MNDFDKLSMIFMFAIVGFSAVNIYTIYKSLQVWQALTGVSNFLALVRGKFPIEVASVERELAEQIKRDKNGKNERTVN